MVSNTEVLTENSPMSPSQYVNVKNPSARKSTHQFSEALEVKPKIDVCGLGDAKSNHKAIRSDSMLWSSIPKRRGHKKSINSS